MNATIVLTLLLVTFGAPLQDDRERRLEEWLKEKAALMETQSIISDNIKLLEQIKKTDDSPEISQQLTMYIDKLRETVDAADSIQVQIHSFKKSLESIAFEYLRRERENVNDSRVGHVLPDGNVLVVDNLARVLLRLERTEATVQELSEMMKLHIQKEADRVDEARHVAVEALRQAEQLTRRVEEERRHALVAPGARWSRWPTPGVGQELNARGMELVETERELQAVAEHLSGKYRERLSEAVRKALQEELRKTLARQFDLRIKLREAEIDELETKLSDLRAEFERRVAQKERLIRRRLEDMIGDDRDPVVPRSR